MELLITGASGFIGRKLIPHCYKMGITNIRVLTRDTDHYRENSPFPVKVFKWNPEMGYIQRGTLDGVDCIIHLAGENIASERWSEKKKKRILESRVQSTRLLIDEIKYMSQPPKKIISASAVGYYGDQPGGELTEESPQGKGFLPGVCLQWEAACLNRGLKDINASVVRTGIVLGESGGALPKMINPFLYGLGGQLNDGRQFMSWIHIEDLVRFYTFLALGNFPGGVFNAVAPYPVTNHQFTKSVATHLHKPCPFYIPAFVLHSLLGEIAGPLLWSQKVRPLRALELGFTFNFETINDCLADLLKPVANGEKVFDQFQFIDRKLKNVFSFFTDEGNLEKITPPFLHFQLGGKNTPSIHQGTHFNYKLKVHGIPTTWESLINRWEPEESFVDSQIKGPYKKWHHTHNFIPIKNGTLIEDRVVYKIPYGTFGQFLTGWLVDRDLKKIFKYRSEKIKYLIDHPNIKQQKHSGGQRA